MLEQRDSFWVVVYEPFITRDLTRDDVRYVVIFGPRGEIKASTFAEGLPLGLREANPVTGDEKISLETLDTSEGSVLDVAMPVLQGGVGTIRVGLSREGLEGQVTQLTLTLLAITAGTLLAGLVVASRWFEEN